MNTDEQEEELYSGFEAVNYIVSNSLQAQLLAQKTTATTEVFLG